MLPVNRSLNASLKWLLRACSTMTDGLPSIVPTPSLMALPDRLRPVPTKIVAERVPSTPCACAAATGAMGNQHRGGEQSIQCQEHSMAGNGFGQTDRFPSGAPAAAWIRSRKPGGIGYRGNPSGMMAHLYG